MLIAYRCTKDLVDETPEVKGANAFTKGEVYQVEAHSDVMVVCENDGTLRYFHDRTFFDNHFEKVNEG